ncbi:hypothetical protein Rumeso_01424 [Rubellimicrobium mesophilum DSM 19309]|uniref:Uncharacterized protein n=1 Tax=Rubellimicrobium mesophilum DSM 19309 TaxID=442562 RepID=A0A017HQX1_9RHOB|nr:hypothetical protein Rumeso_01424 [Rubellimicrobium mesophilum DSM 19309]
MDPCPACVCTSPGATNADSPEDNRAPRPAISISSSPCRGITTCTKSCAWSTPAPS